MEALDAALYGQAPLHSMEVSVVNRTAERWRRSTHTDPTNGRRRIQRVSLVISSLTALLSVAFFLWAETYRDADAPDAFTATRHIAAWLPLQPGVCGWRWSLRSVVWLSHGCTANRNTLQRNKHTLWHTNRHRSLRWLCWCSDWASATDNTESDRTRRYWRSRQVNVVEGDPEKFKHISLTHGNSFFVLVPGVDDGGDQGNIVHPYNLTSEKVATLEPNAPVHQTVVEVYLDLLSQNVAAGMTLLQLLVVEPNRREPVLSRMASRTLEQAFSVEIALIPPSGSCHGTRTAPQFFVRRTLHTSRCQQQCQDHPSCRQLGAGRGRV